MLTVQYFSIYSLYDASDLQDGLTSRFKISLFNIYPSSPYPLVTTFYLCFCKFDFLIFYLWVTSCTTGLFLTILLSLMPSKYIHVVTDGKVLHQPFTPWLNLILNNYAVVNIIVLFIHVEFIVSVQKYNHFFCWSLYITNYLNCWLLLFLGRVFRVFYTEDHIIYKQRQFYYCLSWMLSFVYLLWQDF